MLQEIVINNFQSHRKSTITLTPGVNVITGTSDSGKSSIFRSCIWVAQNRPSGDSIKNWSCKKDDEVVVELILDDGCVAKERINGKAKYLLDTLKGSWEFEAFKSDVPKEIEDVLNLTELNIQNQHTPYFLLDDSPGERARKLNELVHLDVIDTIFKNLNSKILETKRLIDFKEKQEGELTNEIENLEYLDDVNHILIELDNQVTAFNNSVSHCEQIKSLCTTISTIGNDIKEAAQILVIGNRASALSDQTGAYQVKKGDYDNLASLVGNILKLNTDIETEHDWLSVESRAQALQNSILAYKTAKSDSDIVKTAVGDLNELEKEIVSAKNGLNSSEKKLRALLLKHKTCPVCYQKITEDVIDRILS
jgi:DNA repair protein SbcC/Rad50